MKADAQAMTVTSAATPASTGARVGGGAGRAAIDKARNLNGAARPAVRPGAL